MGISCGFLGDIWGILWHILGNTWGYLGDILGIYLGYFQDIFKISWVYIEYFIFFPPNRIPIKRCSTIFPAVYAAADADADYADDTADE